MALNLLILGGSRTSENARNAVVGDTVVTVKSGKSGSIPLSVPARLLHLYRLNSFAVQHNDFQQLG
jgi:hypothetical protein